MLFYCWYPIQYSVTLKFCKNFSDKYRLVIIVLSLAYRLPRTFVIQKPMDIAKMIEEADRKRGEPYCGTSLNCVDAVASVLIAGGLTELKDYKKWSVPYPSKPL